MTTKNGLFITFEGGEGSGKSVQSKILAEFLKAKGYDVVLTREPGGTIGADEIRKLVLTGETERWEPKTEALLYLAARADHWHNKIKPSLDEGNVVISDRFQDSSIVYQGICKGVDISLLDMIYSYITGGRQPDRKYLLSVDPEIGIKRSLARAGNTETRFENMNLEFHKKVHDGFMKLAQKNSKRFLTIDGSGSIEDISKIICEDVEQIFERLPTA